MAADMTKKMFGKVGLVDRTTCFYTIMCIWMICISDTVFDALEKERMSPGSFVTWRMRLPRSGAVQVPGPLADFQVR